MCGHGFLDDGEAQSGARRQTNRDLACSVAATGCRTLAEIAFDAPGCGSLIGVNAR